MCDVHDLDKYTCHYDILTRDVRKYKSYKLNGKEDEVKDFVYNPTEPIDTDFNKTDRFFGVCELVSDPISDQQQVNLGYTIVSKNSTFRDSLKVWNKTPKVDKTYAKMKMCMRKEYNNLDECGALIANNSAFNQANTLQKLNNCQERMSLRM